MTDGKKIQFIWGFAAAVIAGVMLIVPPSTLNQDYFDFADLTPFLGIDNGKDVLSNLMYLAGGLWGWSIVRGVGKEIAHIKTELMVFFIGAVLVCFGSGFFHLYPDYGPLVLDRLPMAVAFSGLFAIVLKDRLGERWPDWGVWALITIGFAAVLYWYFGQQEVWGLKEDQRPYFLFQYLPVVLMLLVMKLFPKAGVVESRYILAAFALYGLAVVLEQLDACIFDLTKEWISGHSLKHIASGLAIFVIADMVRRAAKPEPKS